MAERTLDLLLVQDSEASKVLLKDPHAATHSSWHLWLPPHFNASLDLRFIWRQQVKNKEIVSKWKEWSQGSSFCFNEGAIIYDRDVSGLETWGEKLDTIDFYVVIGHSKPAISQPGRDLSLEDSNSTNRNQGSVNIKIYMPTSDHGSVLSGEYTVTQEQFVLYAISGRL
jgi:hypothetical protein